MVWRVLQWVAFIKWNTLTWLICLCGLLGHSAVLFHSPDDLHTFVKPGWLVREVQKKSICTERMAWCKKRKIWMDHKYMFCVAEGCGLREILLLNRANIVKHTHINTSAVRIRKALISLRLFLYPLMGYGTFSAFHTTSSAWFIMWNTGSTNSESILSCFLRRAWILPEMAQ